jgi:N-acetylglucosaminyldiphosphoundecaprenol N-acetyl-beta-D-mannosaminyltransferase
MAENVSVYPEGIDNGNQEPLREGGALQWPPKFPVLGVDISATTYEEAVNLIASAAGTGERCIVTAFPVHGVVTASSDQGLLAMVNSFDLVLPDGQPVRWALNLLYGTRLRDRVYGPELMLRLCRRAAEEGIGVYLYGSYPIVLAGLRANLLGHFPLLSIVGVESPPFRSLTPAEDLETVERINASGAGLIFIGLGCPLQDRFAFVHRHTIHGVQICVGAAFDFHSGNKRMAPAWMQRNGLEWIYRLLQEPRRLLRRYLTTNSSFLIKLFKQCVLQKIYKKNLVC